MQEEIVSGKKFRRLIDAATDKWQRISFWSKASDCVMEDENGNETTVENEIQDIKSLIEDNRKTTISIKKGITASTLNDLVEQIMKDSDPMAGMGTINIETNKVLGKPFLGCFEYFAQWYNIYDQTENEIELHLTLFPHLTLDPTESDAPVNIFFIRGKNGSYNVVKRNKIEFGIDGSTSALRLIGGQSIDAWSKAETVRFPNTSRMQDYIITLVACGSGADYSKNWDCWRVIYATAMVDGNNLWKTFNLASSGDSRFSIDKENSSAIAIKVNKGSWAIINLYELNRI